MWSAVGHPSRMRTTRWRARRTSRPGEGGVPRMQQPPILTCRLAPQRAAPRAISAADARSHMIRKSRRQQRHRLLAPDADDQRHEFSSSRAADAPRVRRGRLQKIALSWAFVRANRMLRSPPPRVRFPASPPASDLTRCSSGALSLWPRTPPLVAGLSSLQPANCHQDLLRRPPARTDVAHRRTTIHTSAGTFSTSQPSAAVDADADIPETVPPH
jgi:hypothetical protein